MLRSSAPFGIALAMLVGCLAALQPACGIDLMGTADPVADGGLVLENGGNGGSLDGSSAGLDKPTTCPADHLTCGGQCIDPSSDSANCGACGKACAFNQGCAKGACFLLCAPGTTGCGDKCVDLTTDLANCGKCGAPCADTLVCSQGACKSNCASGLMQCTAGTAPVCANLDSDPNNCGKCGKVCAATERCTTGVCTSFCAAGITVGDVFAPKMVGCVGKVSFADRATLCAPGVPACGVATYRARPGKLAPHYNYWTNDVLYGAGNTQTCAVSPSMSGGYGSCSSTAPMRVCAAHTDAVGNQCNGINCGYQAYSPSEYFGGCSGDNTAGTLCCPP